MHLSAGVVAVNGNRCSSLVALHIAAITTAAITSTPTPTEALSDTVGVVYPHSHKLALGCGTACKFGYIPLAPADIGRLRKAATSCCVYLFWHTFTGPCLQEVPGASGTCQQAAAADCTPPSLGSLAPLPQHMLDLHFSRRGFGMGLTYTSPAS